VTRISSKESSVMGLHSSTSTHDPYKQVYILKLVFVLLL